MIIHEHVGESVMDESLVPMEGSGSTVVDAGGSTWWLFEKIKEFIKSYIPDPVKKSDLPSDYAKRGTTITNLDELAAKIPTDIADANLHEEIVNAQAYDVRTMVVSTSSLTPGGEPTLTTFDFIGFSIGRVSLDDSKHLFYLWKSGSTKYRTKAMDTLFSTAGNVTIYNYNASTSPARKTVSSFDFSLRSECGEQEVYSWFDGLSPEIENPYFDPSSIEWGESVVEEGGVQERVQWNLVLPEISLNNSSKKEKYIRIPCTSSALQNLMRGMWKPQSELGMYNKYIQDVEVEFFWKFVNTNTGEIYDNPPFENSYLWVKLPIWGCSALDIFISGTDTINVGDTVYSMYSYTKCPDHSGTKIACIYPATFKSRTIASFDLISYAPFNVLMSVCESAICPQTNS